MYEKSTDKNPAVNPVDDHHIGFVTIGYVTEMSYIYLTRCRVFLGDCSVLPSADEVIDDAKISAQRHQRSTVGSPC
jgi:hypothetical protein